MVGLWRKHCRGIATLLVLSIVMTSSVAFAGGTRSTAAPYPKEIDSVFRSLGFDSYQYVGLNDQLKAYEYRMPDGRPLYMPLHVAEKLDGCDMEEVLRGVQSGVHPCVKVGAVIIAVFGALNTFVEFCGNLENFINWLKQQYPPGSVGYGEFREDNWVVADIINGVVYYR